MAALLLREDPLSLDSLMPQNKPKPFISGIASSYGDRLRRFFGSRLRNRADAPDLVQEVFLRLMRIDHQESIRSPEAYLFTVANHVLYQHSLRESAVPPKVDISEVLGELQISSGDDPLSRVDAQQRLRRLENTLANLPPKLSTTLLLHRFRGVPISDIAKQLGVSRPAAKKYLAKALTHCRDAVRDREGAQ